MSSRILAFLAGMTVGVVMTAWTLRRQRYNATARIITIDPETLWALNDIDPEKLDAFIAESKATESGGA